MKPREFAGRALCLRDRESPGEFLEAQLETLPGWEELAGPDRGLARELVLGVCRWRKALDALIDRRARQAPRDPRLRNLLRLGVYQLFFLDRIPAHAAVDESVALAKAWGLGRQAGFVNALLRGASREGGATLAWLEALQKSDPATGWSHPDWLIGRWRGRWGLAEVEALLKWNNEPPSTFARVHRCRTDAERLRERWQSEGVEAVPVSRDWFGPDAVFELVSHPPLAGLGSFKDGEFYVQDPSTLLAASVLDPQPGWRVWDACAAPGGKCCHVADRMGDLGLVVARDLDARRLEKVSENVSRLRLRSVRIEEGVGLEGEGDGGEGDGGEGDGGEGWDAVLLDVPCSNTGVMRRRVELRWRIREEELGRLVATQLRLLEVHAGRVRVGGVLVYSTCSLEPEENRGVVRRFLEGHPGYVLESERELVPFREAVDGAYVARLRRQ